MWHGWADAGLSPLATMKYYDEVKARDPKADDFMRVFMMPGVLHCAGGPGPDNVDWVTTMVDWVENGKAPDRVIAQQDGTECRRDAHTAALSVPAARRVQGQRQHGR